MEFNCPACQTKLRVPDDAQNPKVRCRACGNIFRPLESTQPSEPRSPTRPPLTQSANPFDAEGTGPNSPVGGTSPPIPERPRPSSRSAPSSPGPVITPRSSSSGQKSGWGIGFFILVMLLSRAPRLLQNFKADPAPPPPVKFDDDLLRQLELDLERTGKSDDEVPELPDGVDINDLNLKDVDLDEQAP